MGKVNDMLILQRVHWQEMAEHVASLAPQEACGLLAGLSDRSQAVFLTPNRLGSPTTFEMEPVAQVQALLEIERRGWDLLAIYHSHPCGPNTPSPDDLRRHAYPQALALIWTPGEMGWTCRAYCLTPPGYQEIVFLLEE